MENKAVHLTGYLDNIQSLSCVLSYPENLEGNLNSVSGKLINISNTFNVQTKTVTPSISQQIIFPDNEYNYLSRVIINAIPYTETLNETGGITVRIG